MFSSSIMYSSKFFSLTLFAAVKLGITARAVTIAPKNAIAGSLLKKFSKVSEKEMQKYEIIHAIKKPIMIGANHLSLKLGLLVFF